MSGAAPPIRSPSSTRASTINWILSAGAGGGYASYAHAFAPYPERAHSRQAAHRRAEHAGRRRHPRDDLSQLGRAEGRHHHRPGAFERAVRAALRHPRRQFRSAPDELDRQHHVGVRHLRVLGHVRHHATGRTCSSKRVHRRRHRRGLADGNHADDAQQAVRHQDQGHLRLQGRQRRLSRDGARRGARPLRRARLLDQVDAAGLVPAEEDRGADPDRARSAIRNFPTSRR